METEERLIPAREVAARIGIKVQTLTKWRMLGKGPQNWVKISKTFVCYPEKEVERWLAELRREA